MKREDTRSQEQHKLQLFITKNREKKKDYSKAYEQGKTFLRTATYSSLDKATPLRVVRSRGENRKTKIHDIFILEFFSGCRCRETVATIFRELPSGGYLMLTYKSKQ